MHLLDTDTLTHLYEGNSKVIQQLRTLAGSEVGTTIFTKIEMVRGRMDFVLKANTGDDILRAQVLLSRTEELLSQILIVPMNSDAALQFERLSATSRLRKIGRVDLLIASVALSRRATLVTRNLRHFRQIPGLKLENWVDS
jgi:tRNA(fMet)-specific endonuclease VapC